MRLLFFLLLVVLVVLLVLLVLDWRRGRELQRGSWRSVTRSLEQGGFVVRLECPGEHPQVVEQIPGELPSDELGSRLADAQAEADARAAELNVMRRLERRSLR